MKIKWVFFAVLAVCFVFIQNTLKAVNTTEIKRVLTKGVLSEQDYQVIDEFMAGAIQELVRTRDLTTIAKRRTVILSHQGKQGQYAQRYSQAARKYIQAGLQEAETLPPERRTPVIVNLLILIDGLQDVRLIDLAIGKLNNPEMVIRYWAVSCLTNPTVLTQMSQNNTSNPVSYQTIVNRLDEAVPGSNAETLARMIRFVTNVDIPASDKLLLRIADERIKRYAQWTVRYTLYDINLLKILTSKILSSSGAQRAEMAQRFGQLYAYAFQRLLKGTNAGVLDDTQIRHVLSILVEIEEKCIGRLMGESQSTIKRAAEQGNLQELLQEHDRLLGTQDKLGELPFMLGFDYGNMDNGAKRSGPIPLPDPPSENVN